MIIAHWYLLGYINRPRTTKGSKRGINRFEIDLEFAHKHRTTKWVFVFRHHQSWRLFPLRLRCVVQLHAINSLSENILQSRQKGSEAQSIKELRFAIINNRRLIFLNVLMVYFCYFQLLYISCFRYRYNTGCRNLGWELWCRRFSFRIVLWFKATVKIKALNLISIYSE
jgi:hypothetical protein